MKYNVDTDKLRATWQGLPLIKTAEDLFRVSLDFGQQGQVVADTHLFPTKPVRLLPYSDFDSQRRDASGRQYASGDAALVADIPEGDVLFAIKHHRCNNRYLSKQTPGDELKEHLKLQDTHIQVVIGVADRSRGLPGVVTLNSPQSYGAETGAAGRFGEVGYPMIFVRPAYPSYLPARLHRSFTDNIRTMALAFNAVVRFPGNGRYNGGDPLACCSVKALKEHVTQMLFALAGNKSQRKAARDWFAQADNLIYCAEYAFVAASAGCHWPLNAQTVASLTNSRLSHRFITMLERHNLGQSTRLTADNPNTLSRFVSASVAPDDLLPMPAYASENQKMVEQKKLAFKPFTAADIVDHALRLHFEREKSGESIAPVQAAVLNKMMPGFLEILGLDSEDANLNHKEAATIVFTEIVRTVGTQYPSYAEFRAALKPSLKAASMLVGGRSGAENPGNLFVPPCLFHIVAREEHSGGLLGLSYVAHGLHLSLLHGEDAPVALTQQSINAVASDREISHAAAV